MLKNTVFLGLAAAAASSVQATIPVSSVKSPANFDHVEASGTRYGLSVVSRVPVQACIDGNGVESGAEFLVADVGNGRDALVLVANGCIDDQDDPVLKQVDVYNLLSNGTLQLNTTLDLSTTAGPTSVAVEPASGVIAVTATKDGEAGIVRFFSPSLEFLGDFQVGNHPDHVSYGHGDCFFVANEGEGVGAGGVSALCSSDWADFAAGNGSVTASTHVLTGGITNAEAVHFISSTNDLEDLEPEYIAYGKPDQSGDYKIFVALQEAASILVYSTSLTGGLVPETILPLGKKSFYDHPMDIFKEDGKSEQVAVQNVYGMYQMDTMKDFEVSDNTYIIYANEGDGGDDELEINDESICINGTGLDQATLDNMGSLEFSGTEFYNETTGCYDAIAMFGARSFSIMDASNYNVVYDSGNGLEKMVLKYFPSFHNVDAAKSTLSVDRRSNSKGPEPESLAIAKKGEKIFAFVGLERPSLIATYDVTDPSQPLFHSLSGDIDCENGKSNLADPEGLYYIPAEKSPTGTDILISSGSTSNSIQVFEFGAKSSDELYYCGIPLGTTNPTTTSPTTTAPTKDDNGSATSVTITLSSVVAACLAALYGAH